MSNKEKNLQQLAEEDVDAIKALWKKLVIDDVENKIQEGIISIDQKIASLPKDEDLTPSKKEITEIKNISKDIKENVIQEIKDIQAILENQNTQNTALINKMNSLFEKQNKSIDLSKELKEFINKNKVEIHSKIIEMPEMLSALSNSNREMRKENKDILKESRINLFLYILISVSSINLVFNVCQIFGLF